MTNIEKYKDAFIITNMADELVCNKEAAPIFLKLDKETIDRFLLKAEEYDKNLYEGYSIYELPMSIDSSRYIRFNDGGPLDIGRFFPTIQEHIEWMGEAHSPEFIEQFNNLNIVEF